MKNKTKKIIGSLILIMLGIILIGTVYARASGSDDIGKCWWEMNTAHNMAEQMRSLGWENGTIGQKAALAECGKQWTNSNNTRKELEAAAPSPSPNLKYLGNYELTAYEYGTGPNSYNGKAQTVNHTAAADFIPGGTWIYIEGYGEYYVEDTGVGNNHTIDIFMGDPAACRQFGRKYNVPVYIILDR